METSISSRSVKKPEISGIFLKGEEAKHILVALLALPD